MKRKNILLTFIAVLGLLALPIYDWLSNQKVVSFENTGRPLLQSFYQAEDDYKKKSGTYIDAANPEKKTVFHLEDDTYHLYTSVDELPADYKKFLPKETLPYLKKDSFRLILTVKNKYINQVCFWMVDEKGHPKKLPDRLTVKKQ